MMITSSPTTVSSLAPTPVPLCVLTDKAVAGMLSLVGELKFLREEAPVEVQLCVTTEAERDSILQKHIGTINHVLAFYGKKYWRRVAVTALPQLLRLREVRDQEANRWSDMQPNHHAWTETGDAAQRSFKELVRMTCKVFNAWQPLLDLEALASHPPEDARTCVRNWMTTHLPMHLNSTTVWMGMRHIEARAVAQGPVVALHLYLKDWANAGADRKPQLRAQYAWLCLEASMVSTTRAVMRPCDLLFGDFIDLVEVFEDKNSNQTTANFITKAGIVRERQPLSAQRRPPIVEEVMMQSMCLVELVKQWLVSAHIVCGKFFVVFQLLRTLFKSHVDVHTPAYTQKMNKQSRLFGQQNKMAIVPYNYKDHHQLFKGHSLPPKRAGLCDVARMSDLILFFLKSPQQKSEFTHENLAFMWSAFLGSQSRNQKDSESCDPYLVATFIHTHT
jgi:hypothetical protein